MIEDNKTEQPTVKKLADARKKGQVAYSQDFVSAAILVGGVIAFFFFGEFIYDRFTNLYITILKYINTPYDNAIISLSHKGISYFILTITPILLATLIFAIISNISQVGFNFSPIKWNFNIKGIFSFSALMRVVWWMSKFLTISLVYVLILKTIMPQISHLMNTEIPKMFEFIFREGFYISAILAVTLLILGILDLAYQKWKFLQDMRMTKQEIQEEKKQTESIIKTKIQYTTPHFTKNIAQANIIITDSEHTIIALRYNPKTKSVPVCVAKGQRKNALSIEEIAIKNKIPIVKDKLLVRALYKIVEPGDSIPPNFYHKVAEVLSSLLN